MTTTAPSFPARSLVLTFVLRKLGLLHTCAENAANAERPIMWPELSAVALSGFPGDAAAVMFAELAIIARDRRPGV